MQKKPIMTNFSNAFCNSCAMLMRAMTFVAIIHTTTALEATPFIEEFREGIVNWKLGIISSSASFSFYTNEKGKPISPISESETRINNARKEALEYAKDRAVEKLCATLRMLRFDGTKRVGDIIRENEEIKRKLSETISTRVYFRTRPLDFYSESCEAKINFGDVIAALSFDFPELPFPQRDDAKIRTDYTSLIIDARGLEVYPMLLPSIFTEHGFEIYSYRYVNAAAVHKYGMATYCTSETDAMAHKKAGSHPYYISAIRALRGCPVIADRDARRIFASPVTKENLKNCKVIIILSPKETRH
ncbi:MAG: hypothetical protein N2316_11275 [Spirochaetes bacterium]|nr:hypothetical protein [Spirochaetota bacterium]